MYFKVSFGLLVLIFPKTRTMAGIIVQYSFQAILFYKNEYCYHASKYFFLWEFIEIMHSEAANENRPHFCIPDNISDVFQVQNFQIIK